MGKFEKCCLISVCFWAYLGLTGDGNLSHWIAGPVIASAVWFAVDGLEQFFKQLIGK